MATNLENLQTRQAAIYAELAALDATKAGGKPNSGGLGSTVDHVGYKDGLYRELEKIEARIASLDYGEVTSEAY